MCIQFQENRMQIKHVRCRNQIQYYSLDVSEGFYQTAEKATLKSEAVLRYQNMPSSQMKKLEQKCGSTEAH